MPKPQNKPLSSPKTTIQKPPGLRTDGSSVPEQKELRDSAKRFAAEIRKKHGLLDRKTATRMCRHVEYLITPRPTKGRPPQQRITKATEMFESQRRSANGCRVNWNTIARQCIPGYGSFRSEYRRRVELSKLRNAVYARLGRRDTHESEQNRKT